jgi:hypothetical protein
MKKTVLIALRITSEERDTWQAQADAKEVSLSEWIRAQCKSTGTPVPVESAEPAKCRFGGCAKLGRLPCPVCKAQEWKPPVFRS